MRYWAHNTLRRFSAGLATAFGVVLAMCLFTTATLHAEPVSKRHHVKHTTTTHKTAHPAKHTTAGKARRTAIRRATTRRVVTHTRRAASATERKATEQAQLAARRKSAHTEDVAADKATADRVHAWMQSQHAAAAQSASSQPAPAPAAPAAAIQSVEATGVSHPPDKDFAVNIRYEKAGSATTSVPAVSAPAISAAAPAPAVVTAADSKVSDNESDNAEDDEDVPQPSGKVHLAYTRGGRLIVPAPLRGSREILVHQNVMADREGLERVRNDADLLRLRREKKLVAIPVSRTLMVDGRLPVNRRFCRPWTAQFLTDLARAHYKRFQDPIQVNSAVRTVQFQEHLLRVNGNAAPARGELASPHLTGETVDLAKHGLSMTEIAWMRGYLLPLVEEGKIDVEEEFQQAVFHISVYTSYAPSLAPKHNRQERRNKSTNLLATGIH